MFNLKLGLAGSLLSAALLVSGSQACLAQRVFASPQEAGDALVDAARNPGKGALDDIFGKGAKEILSSGDQDVDRERIDDFLALANAGRGVVQEKPGIATLTFGQDGWSFPVPLREKDGKWTFDLAAGKQEIRDRAIGRNELTAIAACGDYVGAQREYYDSLHDDEPVRQFARRFISSAGRHDGLWWQSESPRDQSPLGDTIAAAAVEKVASNDKPTPYYGYIYRILTKQGAAAPGGAYSYIVGGRMLAGFAMIAYPERWGETGVMTFLCDQQGVVYQRNLGPDTTPQAVHIETFDPTKGWEVVHE
ncbi:DUF2950 domain-containing protein [Labrys okinawensis]|uniref:DUF2950 domain-containing protein n=1 Tax=Labrys okinawensis TaxID=346911 RepID=UPI0039BC62A5